MSIEEITLDKLDPQAFIAAQAEAIADSVGGELAINALSGGVDSAVVTMLGHRAIGERLKTYFIENGLMREGESEQIAGWFKALGVRVEIVDASESFFAALKGVTDPEEKREKGITQVFYKDVFARLVRESGARVLLQGTNYTDVEETAAGVKRQHNVFEQIGIDPEEAFGYRVLEPILQLRKPAVRAVARALGLPEAIAERPPFPGPALAARVIGEVTRERVAIVRKATRIVEEELAGSGAFQYLAILHEDMVTGIRESRREFGRQIEVRCWESEDAVTATPTELPFATLRRLGDRITAEVPGVVSVTYNVAAKPPSCIEAV
ncbi:MAG: ExsB family transcriptional regulator [Planctomycetes bacterium]|nr:ExsB family transcriptional regulator [Planctomycetota bacterium]